MFEVTSITKLSLLSWLEHYIKQKASWTGTIIQCISYELSEMCFIITPLEGDLSFNKLSQCISGVKTCNHPALESEVTPWGKRDKVLIGLCKNNNTIKKEGLVTLTDKKKSI